MTHYLNAIDEDEDDDDEDDEEVVKINKRLIPRDYTFYKIYKNGFENYVGSTVDLNIRKSRHKSKCNNVKHPSYNTPVYQYIRANGGYDSFEYEILDKKFVCKRDAELYEGELMKIHNSTLNVFRNYSEADKKEYNKQKARKFRKKNPEYNKKYTEKNIDKKKEYDKIYREKNKEKKKQITINITINLP
jgi:hypothetical protein